MRKKLLFFLCPGTVLICGIFIGVCMLHLHPVAQNTDHNIICAVLYNPNYGNEGDELINITDFDEKQILQCLNAYQECFSWTRMTESVWGGSIAIEILVWTDSQYKWIVLGEKNYTYTSYGAFSYKIQNGEDLLRDLLNILPISISG